MERDFDVSVHGLHHDGKEFRNRHSFDERKPQMREYLDLWGTRGFSSPSHLHNLAWLNELDIDFDVSTFDTDPFEPQPCHHQRIFPFWVQSPDTRNKGFVELPNTLPQDFTLFVLMRERSNAIWRKKLDWIAAYGGMALLKTHPDYMAFSSRDRGSELYPVSLYTDLLDYILDRYKDQVWIAKPSEMAAFWRTLAPSDSTLTIPPSDFHCRACRDACAQGLVTHYRPHSNPTPNNGCLSASVTTPLVPRSHSKIDT